MDEKTVMMLKALRLRGLLEHWGEYMKLAEEKRLSSVKFLLRIIEDEYRGKVEHAQHMRQKQARIPERFVISTYPFARQPKLERKRILAIYDAFQYVLNCRNLVFVGPTGSGKTGLATGFLTQAIERGHSGRFILFADLIAQLYAAVADSRQGRVIRKFASYDCLLIDEIGYVEVEPAQAGLFFTLLQKRHRRKSTLITSNLGFSEWNSFLKSDHLTAALIDRLTENSHVINMRGCISLRAKLGRDE